MKKQIGFAVALTMIAVMADTPFGAAQAQTKTLIYSNGWAKDHVQVGVVADEWIRRIEAATQGRVKIRHIANGTLLKAEATLDGLQKKIADCGAVQPSFTPGELPIASTLGGAMDVELGNKLDIKGVTFITNKLFDEFPEFSAEFGKLGVRAMVWVPVAPYAIISRKPTKDLADVSGQKIRAFGSTLPKFEAAMGATPVAMAFAEMYTSIQTGVIDAGLTDPPAMVTAKLYEVGKHVLTTGPGLGTGMAGASIVYTCSERSLASLSAEDRDAITKVSKGMGGYITDLMVKTSNDAYEELKKRGVTVSHLSAADTEKIATANPFMNDVAQALNKQGLPGDALVKRYRELASDYLSGKSVE